MGNQAEHHAKAVRHKEFLQTIPDEYPDWLATVAFYTAVELIEQLLAERGHHSKSHFDRKQALKKHYPHRTLNQAFHDLYNAALDGRYLPQDKAPSVEDVRNILIGKRLTFIEEYVKSHSSVPSEDDPVCDGGPAAP